MGLPPSRGSVCPCSEDIPHCFRRAVATGCFGFAYVGGFATEQEVLARWSEEIDHLGVFPEPSLVLRAARNDHNVARAADPLFAAEPELHAALEHPDNLLACVAVRFNMNALPRCSTRRAFLDPLRE